MNGLKIQWSLVGQASYGSYTEVTFSLSFTQVPAVSVTTRGIDDTDYGRSNLGQVIATKTGFKCDSQYGSATKVRVYYIAIGY